uniref:Uncharacterized protein n=1 Tax=Octopus bimaculoides TaxID=37653 RepID=A0A0L8H0N8_OCTBM
MVKCHQIECIPVFSFFFQGFLNLFPMNANINSTLFILFTPISMFCNQEFFTLYIKENNDTTIFPPILLNSSREIFQDFYKIFTTF